jgi:hypothetical protein
MANDLRNILIGTGVIGVGIGSGLTSFAQSQLSSATTFKRGAIAVKQRAKTITSMMGRQTLQFLKAGLDLEGGLPQVILKDTYNVGIEDIANIQENVSTSVRNQKSFGTMSFINALFGSTASAALYLQQEKLSKGFFSPADPITWQQPTSASSAIGSFGV